MKREPGDHDIDARQIPTPIVVAIISFVAAVAISLFWIGGDDSVRGNDVEFLVYQFD